MLIKENIDTMIQNIIDSDTEAAKTQFSNIITSKIVERLENMKVDVANQYFNNMKEDVEQIDEISQGLATKAFKAADKKIFGK